MAAGMGRDTGMTGTGRCQAAGGRRRLRDSHAAVRCRSGSRKPAPSCPALPPGALHNRPDTGPGARARKRADLRQVSL
jgi:hypothetical protein